MYVTMVLQMSFEDAFGVHHEERGSHAQVDVQRPLQCMNISIGMFFSFFYIFAYLKLGSPLKYSIDIATDMLI